MTLPSSLSANPRLDRWVRFQPDGTVRVGTGKIEMGQGILTALSQIAAEELDVLPSHVAMMSGDSVEGPAEGYTASSWSVEHSGAAIRQAAAEVRALATALAARRLNVAAADLTVLDGTFTLDGEPTGLDYWAVSAEIDPLAEATGAILPKSASGYQVVGTSLPRIDLPAKLTGSGFIHDMRLPGMLHARTLRQPGRGARLVRLDEAAIRKRAGGEIRIVREANFVAFAGEDETVVRAAAVAAPDHATWDNARRLTPEWATADWVAAQPSHNAVLGDPMKAEELASSPCVTLRASRPFLSHGAIAPSCAMALWRDGRLLVWSHGQGMHPLRAALAETLVLAVEDVECRHVQGAGCYGHNGADDAALDAALVARALPGRPIRLMWRREEEFRYEPLSSAGRVEVQATLGPDGRPVDWTTAIWSATHGQRPGVGGATLLAADALAKPPPLRAPFEIPLDRGGGSTRNGLPIYDIAARRIEHHLIHDVPVRTSSLRGLGATLNVFAIEALIDDLAARAEEDPLAYRLSLLSDPRARAVLERAALMGGWDGRGAPGSGRGLGLGLARYKNSSAWAAIAAEVSVDEAVRVERVWCAVDAGLVINPDGVRNQVEGNIVQAVSWTLIEEVVFGDDGVSSDTWDTYPVIRFSEVPKIEVDLVGPRDAPSLGVGECAGGPTAAAIGNAVSHALGQRIHDMPMTRERIMRALLA